MFSQLSTTLAVVIAVCALVEVQTLRRELARQTPPRRYPALPPLPYVPQTLSYEALRRGGEYVN
jgi:hypothetical protein